VKKAAKKVDRHAELTKLYAEFERERKKIDAAVAKFDHADVSAENKGFYKSFFGIATIFVAAGITTFVLMNSESGNITGAAFAGIGSTIFKNVYFNMILGGIFGLLLVLLIHRVYSRHKE
jgi:hypothetical protein